MVKPELQVGVLNSDYVKPDFPALGELELKPFKDTLKPQSNGPLHSNTVIGTLAVDGWAATFGTARGAWVGCGPAQYPARCTKRNSLPINDQCTNFILFDLAL